MTASIADGIGSFSCTIDRSEIRTFQSSSKQRFFLLGRWMRFDVYLVGIGGGCVNDFDRGARRSRPPLRSLALQTLRADLMKTPSSRWFVVSVFGDHGVGGESFCA